jgi:hypothetical protein
MKTRCVFFEVGNGFINSIQMTFVLKTDNTDKAMIPALSRNVDFNA